MQAASVPSRVTSRCGATTRTGGECQNRAGFKTSHFGNGHCYLHGGKSPNGIKHAQREAAAEAVVVYGLPREIDPQEALLEELYRTAGAISWLQARVADLDEGAVYGPVGGSQFGTPRQEPHVYIVMLKDERRHYESVAVSCVKAGIEERRTQLAEAQGQMLAEAIDLILRDLGVRDHPEAPTVVRRHLTAIAGGA